MEWSRDMWDRKELILCWLKLKGMKTNFNDCLPFCHYKSDSLSNEHNRAYTGAFNSDPDHADEILQAQKEILALI